VLTAVNGPVRNFTISAALPSKVRVAPSSGSLPAGRWVTVTVTVISWVALYTHITVEPGNIRVTVVLSIKP
jgi:hypothetical protein